MSRRRNSHPLLMLFGARRFTADDGMNWLQERGHVSDLCVHAEDVAPADVRRILRLSGFECFLPALRHYDGSEKSQEPLANAQAVA